MQPIKFPVPKLLEVIKKNREAHKEVFLEAQEGYRKAVIEELEKSIAEAKAGKRIKRGFQLVEPMNQTKEYDRIISMLEMTEDTHISLSEQEYAQYVLDDWHWKHQWAVSNSAYSVKAAGIRDSIETD